MRLGPADLTRKIAKIVPGLSIRPQAGPPASGVVRVESLSLTCLCSLCATLDPGLIVRCRAGSRMQFDRSMALFLILKPFMVILRASDRATTFLSALKS